MARLLVEKTLLRPAKSEAELRRGRRSFWALFCLFYWIFETRLPSFDWTPVILEHQRLAAAAASSSVSFPIGYLHWKEKQKVREAVPVALQCVALQLDVTGILQSLCGLLGNCFSHLMPTQ